MKKVSVKNVIWASIGSILLAAGVVNLLVATFGCYEGLCRYQTSWGCCPLIIVFLILAIIGSTIIHFNSAETWTKEDS